MTKLPVAVLGATGAVGQRFIQLLDNHPWFEVAEVAASDRSAGKPYAEACTWRLPGHPPDAVGRLTVTNCDGPFKSQLLFSGLDSSVAGPVEEKLASQGGTVVSNSKNHRTDPDVPLLIPEINADHLAAIEAQRKRGRGVIVTNPNCSVAGLAMALAPLHRAFGLKQVAVVTLQALSGAGYPGVASMDIADNVIPFIGGNEEDKIEKEPRKILGSWNGSSFVDAPFEVSASVHRVDVTDGHTMAIFVNLARQVTPDEAMKALAGFKGEPQALKLPTAPGNPIHIVPGDNRPQPRLDRDREGGMAVSVGRVRADRLFHLKLEAMVHNTIRGAAGAAILNAELMQAKGLLS
jgi:aspartate-semialdehyde dehydrogenase